jgi:carbamate kinase
VTIVEKREIKHLIKDDFIVICCGGGGIPVVREGRAFSGVDAVIDKDLASSKLAEEVGVDIFIIATDVSGAALDFGTEQERYLDRVSLEDAERFLSAGHFPAGSMGPKVDACIRFLKTGGKRAVITSVEAIEKGLKGTAGTQFVHSG